MHCRNTGESNIVFAKLWVCGETGHRRIKRLTWDCTWTQRRGFGRRRGALWLWNSYGPTKKEVRHGMEETVARWECFQRIFKAKSNIANLIRNPLFPEQPAIYFCLHKGEEIGDFYKDIFLESKDLKIFFFLANTVGGGASWARFYQLPNLCLRTLIL